jgi:Heavy metal binding domain
MQVIEFALRLDDQNRRRAPESAKFPVRREFGEWRRVRLGLRPPPSSLRKPHVSDTTPIARFRGDFRPLSSRILVAGNAKAGVPAGEVCVDQRQNAEQFFVCPMHSDVRQPGPGKCSKCRMDLLLALLRHMMSSPLHIFAAADDDRLNVAVSHAVFGPDSCVSSVSGVELISV